MAGIPRRTNARMLLRNTSMDTVITQMAHYSHLSLQIAQVWEELLTARHITNNESLCCVLQGCVNLWRQELDFLILLHGMHILEQNQTVTVRVDLILFHNGFFIGRRRSVTRGGDLPSGDRFKTKESAAQACLYYKHESVCSSCTQHIPTSKLTQTQGI